MLAIAVVGNAIADLFDAYALVVDAVVTPHDASFDESRLQTITPMPSVVLERVQKRLC